MAIVTVNKENLAQEHICCAISAKVDDPTVCAKKQWLADRFAEGLIFQKLDVRGKVFIEYMPAENAWCPIDAEGYLHINCLWVSGQYKGHGHANELLDVCIAEARKQQKKGMTALASPKKKPFLSDAGYLKHNGFQVADTAAPHFELLYLPLEPDAPIPSFKPCCKEGKTAEPGIVIYYTNQCPFAEKYARFAQGIAEEREVPVKLIKLENKEQAQAAPTPCTTYSLFENGTFITQEILSDSKFIKFLEGGLTI